jgi:hypothetical protein
MAQEYKLSFSAEEIDNRLNLAGNAILYTEQNLTEEQKAQVRINLGIDSTEESPSVEDTSITTDYHYEYSGDEDDSLLWIYGSNGSKVFVKVGDVPNGTINYVGATVNRKNKSNQWLDRQFTVTEELLNMTLNRSGYVIPAVQNGIVQIFSKESQDNDYFTAIIVCTKPGTYDIAFQDWGGSFLFGESGIYFYDSRYNGGRDYLESFLFSATYNPSGTNGDNGNGNVVVETPITYSGNEIQIFTRGICIGDSVTDGTFDNAQVSNGTVIRKHSYPAVLERLTGIELANAGIAGATSQSWFAAATEGSDPYWGKWVNQEWVWNTSPTNTGNDIISSTLDFSGFEFAIIHLGINDLLTHYDGGTPLEEILPNYETYINNIITKLKENNI